MNEFLAKYGWERAEQTGTLLHWRTAGFRSRDLCELRTWREDDRWQAAELRLSRALLEHPWLSNQARALALDFAWLVGQEKLELPLLTPADRGILPVPSLEWLGQPDWRSAKLWTRSSDGWQGLLQGEKPCSRCRGPARAGRCLECGQAEGGGLLRRLGLGR